MRRYRKSERPHSPVRHQIWQQHRNKQLAKIPGTAANDDASILPEVVDHSLRLFGKPYEPLGSKPWWIP